MSDTLVRCECGLAYVDGHPEDEALHAKLHDLYANGYPFTDFRGRRVGVAIGMPILEAASTDRSAFRAQFAGLAMVAHRETPDFKAGYYGEDDEASVDRRAYAPIRAGRGVALLIAQRDNRAWPAVWRDDRIYLTTPRADTTPRRVIQRVWVAAVYRRRGMGSDLVDAVLRDWQISIGDAAWEGPFTPAGLAFLRTLRPDGFFLTVGDAGALHEIVAGVLDGSP